MRYVALLVAGLLAGPLFATNSAVAAVGDDPYELVKVTTSALMDRLQTGGDSLTGSPARLREVVNELLVPHFDFRVMARLALGKHWRTASPEERDTFVDEFRKQLVRLYATQLVDYSDLDISYVDGEVKPGAKRASVRSQITRKGGESIAVNYLLHSKSEGWKVFDVRVEGVSLVTTRRAEYDRQVQTTGIQGLLDLLVEQNSTASEN